MYGSSSSSSLSLWFVMTCTARRSSDLSSSSHITNQRDNDEEELDPSILENLLLDDIDDDLTENHPGSDANYLQPV